MKPQIKNVKTRNKQDEWSIEWWSSISDNLCKKGDSPLLHNDTNCKAARSTCKPLCTVSDLTNAMSRSSRGATLCPQCTRTDHTWEARDFNVQAQYLLTADRWMTQMSQPGWVVGVDASPALLGLLLKTVSDWLMVRPVQPKHPALQHIRRQLQTQINRVLDNHPYTEEAAIEEACVLGAKEIAGTEISMTTADYDLGSEQGGVYCLLGNWYDAITRLDDAPKATAALRQTLHYQKVLRYLPVLADIVTGWEETFARITTTRNRMVFYSTRAIHKMFVDCPNSVDSTVELVGLKARSAHNGIGELPELAVAWLTRHGGKPGAHLYTERVALDHQHLTGEQWAMALTLWEEATENNDTYAKVDAAISAALKL